MQEKEVSIIFPVHNAEQEITGLLRALESQLESVDAEFIIVDMGSIDLTVLEAVQFMKEEKLPGFVIQNGDGSIPVALNTGIQKASGRYITFLFADRLYKNYLVPYLETALRMEAEVVFGCFKEEEAIAAERHSLSKAVKKQSGTDYMKEMLYGNLSVNLSALLLKRQFLKEKQLYFNNGLHTGYEEEFIFRCLLSSQAVVQSPVILQRDTVFELKPEKTRPADKQIFQKVEAMLRVYDMLRTSGEKDEELIQLFAQQKLPQTIMECVDALLETGKSISAVKSYLRVADYNKLLVSGKKTEKYLRQKIVKFKTLPWLYLKK